MKKYQYQIIRYIHDRLTNEFVNIGIVIYQLEDGFLKSRFLEKFGRISHFFNDINGHHLIVTLKQFEKEITRISIRTDEIFFNYKNINDITNLILPKDDSAIECSDIFYGIDVDLESALNDLFERLINKYNPETDKERHDDKYVWRNIYKKYFDKYDITRNLKSHSVKTPYDIIEFDKAWKNGIWQCYQTLSFDLKRKDNIKSKVYKWSGILNELESSNEELHLHFLTISPKIHKSEKKFIKDTLQRSTKLVQISLVSENEAEDYARKVKKEIHKHNN